MGLFGSKKVKFKRGLPYMAVLCFNKSELKSTQAAGFAAMMKELPRISKSVQAVSVTPNSDVDDSYEVELSTGGFLRFEKIIHNDVYLASELRSAEAAGKSSADFVGGFRVLAVNVPEKSSTTEADLSKVMTNIINETVSLRSSFGFNDVAFVNGRGL